MDIYELMRSRYSVRKFAEQPVEPDKLDKVLAAGACAPTAKNQQPQRIYVLESEEALAKIRSITRCAFNAPCVLLVCGDKEVAWTNPFNGRNSAEMDCSIVTTQMMLQAQELGLGTCWVCWFDTELTRKEFEIPQNQEVFALLPMGYPAESSVPSANHDSRKDLCETVVRK